jgi:NAD(P)H dehydrogenase (quinone)
LERLGAEVVVGNVHKIDEIREALEGIDAAYMVYPVQSGLIEAPVYFAGCERSRCFRHRESVAAIGQPHVCQSFRSRHLDCRAPSQLVGAAGYSSSPNLLSGMAPLLLALPILRTPVGKGRHAPIGSEDTGRVVAAILQNPTGHAGQTYPLFGPVEMDHEQMAAELTEASGRKIVFQTFRSMTIASCWRRWDWLRTSSSTLKARWTIISIA